MNGIAVAVLAAEKVHCTIETGAQVYASLKGQYTSLTAWTKNWTLTWRCN